MASSAKDFCTLCHDGGPSNEAVSWCTECEVVLCKECEKHHSKSSKFRNHKTMSINDYNNLPAFIQTISSQCRDHKEKFERYCSFHACPCCVQCITVKHKKCQEIKPLSDVLKQFKSSASVLLFEQDLKNLQENYEDIIQFLKSRINTNNIQKTNAIEEIRSMRKSINDYLNILEKDIIDDLESKHSKLKLQMNNLLEQIKQQANQSGQMLNEFSKMKIHATELQMYVGLREMEKKTFKAAEYKDNLERGDSFNENNLQVNIAPVLQSVLQGVKSFGEVNIRTGPSTLRLNPGRKDQAQYLVQNIPGIDEIKVSYLRKLIIPQNMKSIQLFASVILPDGRVLILASKHHDKRLLLFSNEGIFIREVVTLTYNANECCFVKNNTVAVSLESTKQTVLVDVEKNKIIQRIKISHNCNGVTSDGQIVVISNDQKSTTVNLKDMSQTVLKRVNPFSLSLFKGNIYGTINDGKVCCYKSTGELVWTFKHDDIYNPYKLALDKNGFVYIASFGTDSILVVSPDGSTSKTLLSISDGIIDPFTIDINRETGLMIVSSKIRADNDERDNDSYQTVLVYKI